MNAIVNIDYTALANNIIANRSYVENLGNGEYSIYAGIDHVVVIKADVSTSFENCETHVEHVELKHYELQDDECNVLAIIDDVDECEWKLIAEAYTTLI